MKEKNIKLNLQFFNAESEGRTEKATGKKRQDVRKKGQVAKSHELNTAVILLTFFIFINFIGKSYLSKLEEFIVYSISIIPSLVNQSNNNNILKVLSDAILKILSINMILWMGLFVAAFLISYIQVGYHPTFQPLAPKFNKMNPISGMKKLFSKDSVVELLKSIGKVIFLGSIAYSIIISAIPTFLNFYQLTALQEILNVASVTYKIGLWVGISFFALSIGDYAYQKYKFEDSIKMTKQEVKDEYKQAEGDPQIKGKIKQKMREMSFKRMMQAIPEADVIITNPTHFAVAIRYDQDKDRAPIVVAKGADYIAKKIKEIAKEHNIHIIENKPLARTLYYTVDLEKEIPPELYSAVAEVLAFVYKLENKRRERRNRA